MLNVLSFKKSLIFVFFNLGQNYVRLSPSLTGLIQAILSDHLARVDEEERKSKFFKLYIFFSML